MAYPEVENPPKVLLAPDYSSSESSGSFRPGSDERGQGSYLKQHHLSAQKGSLAAYLLIAGGFFLIGAVWHHLGSTDFGEARVYATAIAAFHAGTNPYDLASGALPFVYPPMFLYAGAFLTYIAGARLASLIYLALLAASILAIPWLFAKHYLRSRWLTPAIAMLLFAIQPHFLGEDEFLTGNVALPIYALLLVTALPGLRRNRWLWFYLAIVAGALIKPPFLAFLVLPLFLSRRQLLPSVIAGAVTLASYLAQALFFPTLFHAFQNAVRVEMMDRGDVGYGSLALFRKLDQHFPRFDGFIAPCACLLLTAALLAMMLSLRRRTPTLSRRLWLPMLLVFAVIANPRMEPYDAVIPFVPAIFLCVECAALIRPRTRRISVVAVFLCIEAFFLLKHHSHTAVSILFTVSILFALRTLAAFDATTSRSSIWSNSERLEPAHDLAG